MTDLTEIGSILINFTRILLGYPYIAGGDRQARPRPVNFVRCCPMQLQGRHFFFFADGSFDLLWASTGARLSIPAVRVQIIHRPTPATLQERLGAGWM